MQFAGILSPESQTPAKLALNSGAASAAIHIGRNKKFSIVGVDANLEAVPIQVGYGYNSSIAADATDELFPPGKFVLSTGRAWEYISVFNPTSAAITVYVTLLSNT